jgi:two-component system, chemotaxis family, response regulator Rcp1
MLVSQFAQPGRSGGILLDYPESHAMNRPVEILVVEDNPADAHLAKDALLAGSVRKRVNVVTDGVQAMDYIRRRGAFRHALRPDLVLLDLNLPKRGGLEVLRELKADPELRSITVIVLTTSSYEADVNSAYELLANCYVVKPLDLEAFIAMMKSIEEFWMGVASLPNQSQESKEGTQSGESRGEGEAMKSSGAWSHAHAHRANVRTGRNTEELPVRVAGARVLR